MNIMTNVSGFLSLFTPEIKPHTHLIAHQLMRAFCGFSNFQYICEGESLTLQGVSAAILSVGNGNDRLLNLERAFGITRGGVLVL